MEDQQEINKLIYEILWEIQYFGDFGTRKDYIEKQLETLKELLNKTEE